MPDAGHPLGGSLLDRAAILRAFDKLASELARRRVRADLFVVGGAAIALTYDVDRRTRDIDAVFDDPGIVYDAARTVARRMRLPDDWLNDAVRTYLLGPDHAAQVAYERDSLQVTVASPPYLLAMKLLAARAEQDQPDIRLLYRACGLSTAGDGLALVRRFLPDDDVPARTVDLLEAMFEAAGTPGGAPGEGPDTGH